MIDYKEIEGILDSKGIRFRTELWDSAYMLRNSYGVFAVGIPACIGKDYTTHKGKQQRRQ